VTEEKRDPDRREEGFGYSEAVERILALETEVAELRARLEPLIETIARRLASGGVPFEGPPPASGLGSSPAEAPRSADSSSATRPAELPSPSSCARKERARNHRPHAITDNVAPSDCSPSLTRPVDPAEWDPRRKAECPECGRVVSADSFARHRRRAHSASHSAQGDDS